MHAPFLGMHQEPKKQKPPEHRGGHFEETRFRNSVFRASSGSAAQGTVASPGPVAGSDVTIGPLLMLVHLLSAVLVVVNGTQVLSVGMTLKAVLFGHILARVASTPLHPCHGLFGNDGSDPFPSTD